jgi:hypothetical protein
MRLLFQEKATQAVLEHMDASEYKNLCLDQGEGHGDVSNLSDLAESPLSHHQSRGNQLSASDS